MRSIFILSALSLLLISASCQGEKTHGGETVGESAAALSVSTTADEDLLANAILGGDSAITITNADYTGSISASGTYTDGPLGLPPGALLTTGKAQSALPPDDGGQTGSSMGEPGDDLCANLIGVSTGFTYDAAKLTIEFDLSPDFQGISFLSVFGSEEYPEWVGSSFNDVFGVFLNGQPIPLETNQNHISINGGFFSSSNVVVSPATMTEYDGSTGILQTKAPLTPGSTGNLLEIVVCDAGDGFYDSGAFITALSGCVDNCSGTDVYTGGGGGSGGGSGGGGGGSGNNGNNGGNNGNNGGNNGSNGNGCGRQDNRDDDSTQVRFTYNRAAAASAAVALSAKTPDEVGQIKVPSLDHPSGYFMSLAYRAGGLPMVQGWRAEVIGNGNNRTLNGYGAWNSHNDNSVTAPHTDAGLIGYISGSGAGDLPNAGMFEFHYGGSTVAPNPTQINVSNVYNSGLLNVAGMSSAAATITGAYEPGDYVFIDSWNVDANGAPILKDGQLDYLPHGFMLVGFGPAIRCANTHLEKVEFHGCGAAQGQGCSSTSITVNPGVEYVDNGNGVNIQVPYLADWNGEKIQTQTPRPFYCSVSTAAQRPNGSTGFFSHSYWLFYRAPSHGWVDASVFADADFAVTTQGHIHHCP